jgi:hypothetical protein
METRMIGDAARFQQAISKFDAVIAQNPNQEIFEGKSITRESLWVYQYSMYPQ